jgi:hypothetical protein
LLKDPPTALKALMTLRSVMSTGLLLDQLPMLKTKDNVDHAGPSQLLELLNHFIFSRDKIPIYLSNNLLTAQDPKETKDAMVDGHQVHLTMLKLMESLMEDLILMLPEIKAAKLKVELGKSVESLATLDAMD